MKTYSKDNPIIVRSGGKILVPYNVENYTDSEDNEGYQFNYFEIDDTGQDLTDETVVSGLTAMVNKHIGTKILGVMCSATAEDQWGLGTIQSYISAGNNTEFHFSNGNTLILTPENINEFETAWVAFRQSFFATES
jgi:hypothetical protein